MRSRVIERNMFYGAGRNIFEKARHLRRDMTDAEKIMWKELKNRQKFPVRFKRQHPIDIFIVDFYCHKYKLVIEIDGEIHNNVEIAERDEGRTHDLEKRGIKILRFTNNQVRTNINYVLQKISVAISSSTPL
jgi:very-short-patch-repair endonuclease